MTNDEYLILQDYRYETRLEESWEETKERYKRMKRITKKETKTN